jgi:peptidoglycan/LPS O-acetylase OafA/YrhL
LLYSLGALTAQTYLVLSAHKPSIKEHKFGQLLLTISLIGLGLISLAWSTEITGDVFRSMMLNFGCAAPIALLIFCVSRYQSGVREALSVDRLRGLGDLSYSIYVMHTWILWIFMRPGPPGPATAGTIADALLRMAVGIALTLIVSTATYRLIEVPGRLWLRARLGSELTKRMGSRDENLLAPTGMSQFRHVVAPLGGLALFLAVCLAYQFIVVARYP